MPQGFVKLKGWKGCNFTDPPTEIADDELAWSRNCWGDKRGYVVPRQVQRLDASGGGFIIGSSRFDEGVNEAGVYPFIDSTGQFRLIFYSPYDTDVFGDPQPRAAFYFSGAGAPALGLVNASQLGLPETTDPAALPVLNLQRPLGATRRPVSLVYNNELFLFLGHTYPALRLGADDFKPIASTLAGGLFRKLGPTWTAFTGAIDTQFKFSFGDVYRGVFMMGGLPPPFESLLAFTQGIDNTGAPAPAFNSLLTTSKWAGIGFGDGDRLLRAITTPLVGGASVVEPYALALKQRSVWLVQGAPPTATDNGSLVVTPLMKREGLVAPHAVCHTPHGIAWCSGQNVWLMPPGTQPIPIGDKIKGFLRSCPQVPTESWFMEFHEDVLYLNVPSDNSMVTGQTYNGSGTGPFRTYFPTQQLWCDLRNPSGPRWWGPMDVRASHMASIQLAQGPRQLVGVTAIKRSDVNATQQLFFQMADGAPQGLDLGDSGTTNFFQGGLDDAGSNVPCSTYQIVRTRDMDFGDDSLEKILDATEVTSAWDIGLDTAVNPTAGTDKPFILTAVGDGGRNPNIFAAPFSANPGDFTQASPSQVGFVLDRNALDGAGSAPRLAETFIPVTFFPNSSSRFLARTIQLLLTGQQVSPASQLPVQADQILTRRFRLRSITLRVRPIGRRPGGSYGG